MASNICATPILYLNMGGEMLYVLQQRLQTQRINPDKTIQVMNDVIYALLNSKQLEIIFESGSLMGLTSLRVILERVVLSSIMKLDTNSMNKLFDLMIMMVKYQLATATGPREVILSTLNHLDAIRDMAVDRNLSDVIELTYRLFLDNYGHMTHKEIWQIRNICLREIQDHCVRVSILLRLGMQNQDTSFNRLIQRYDEKYENRKEILENVKLLEYNDEENIMGSLTIFGDRVTLLGKNVYSSSYGYARNSKSSQSLNHIVAVSNKAMKQELETLATQLGKEETMPKRPFSLHLFTNDNDRTMECNSNDSNVGNANVEDEQGNLESNKSESFNDYRNNLMDNVNADFSENDETRTETMDLMNMFDVI